MKITPLVENTTECGLKTRAGLSFYIETPRHHLLFDLGPDKTLFENARKKSIDLTKVDTVILSHGHMDHGGALREFLRINPTAKVYVQRKAFEPHYSKTLFLKIPVGIHKALASHPRVCCLDGDFQIDDELRLFTVTDTSKCHSPANDCLLDPHGRDSFAHEQNLLITEGSSCVLVMGCGHAGVVNILEKAKPYDPQVCVGGFHLHNPIMTVSPALLDEIAKVLRTCGNTRFYTCHCTGKKPFAYLKRQVPNLFYLSCGQTIDV